MAIHANANGWRSTKLHLALITMVLMVGAFLMIGHPAEQFSAFCMGLLGAAGIFSSAAVAEKFTKP